MEAAVNLNADCVKAIHDWGETTYVNLCGGVQHGITYKVPWGTMDWVLMGIIGMFIIFILAMLISVTRR